LGGVARYLFVPLAEAVVFAMLASYFLSRTLVPTMALYLLKPKDHHAATSRNPFVRFQDSFERGFEGLRLGYQRLLTTLVHRRFMFVPVFLLLCLSAWALVPWLGENFFPDTDSGHLAFTCVPRRARALKRLHALPISSGNSIRRVIPPQELDNVLDNIGLPYSTINYMHSTSGLIGAGDADILVSLKENHRPTAEYVRGVAQKAAR
jgi:multidrug efflux pump subunit AcrB